MIREKLEDMTGNIIGYPDRHLSPYDFFFKGYLEQVYKSKPLTEIQHERI